VACDSCCRILLFQLLNVAMKYTPSSERTELSGCPLLLMLLLSAVDVHVNAVLNALELQRKAQLEAVWDRSDANWGIK
jgi:hypothetical protein